MADFVPTPEQEAALGADTPLLILAGAGTGKTTVLTHRIANLIAGGRARPDQVLALTFAEKAAAEMGERLAVLLEERGMGDAGREVKCSTYHSFGLELIQEYAPLLGLEADCRVMSTPESWQLLSRVVNGMEYEAIELPMGGLGKLLAGMLGFFSRAKDHLVGPQEVRDLAAAQELSRLSDVAREYWEARLAALSEVAESYRRYEEAKRERNLLDYGDLLVLPVRLLGDQPDVRESLQRRYPELYVDEYQDTNHAQRVLLIERLLSPEARIVVIGDDDQSIYGWRGAVLRNILGFLEEGRIKGARPNRRELVVNRRSGQQILDVANLVISLLPETRRYPKRLRPREEAPSASVMHCVAATDESEARWIAGTIEAGRGKPEFEDPTGKKRGYGAFAVLCRKRSLFPAIAKALEARGIPYELVGGMGFFGRWEIRDILSYLRVIANPADNIALARVLQSRSWRLADRDLFHLSEWAQAEARKRKAERSRREESSATDVAAGGDLEGGEGGDDLEYRLFDAVARLEEVRGLSPDARERLGRLRELLDDLSRGASRASVGDLVEQVVERAGYRRELSARSGFDAQVGLLNLQKLVEMARQYRGADATLAAYVEYVEYALESGGDEDEVRPVDEGSDAVKIMTVHQSKGLEFPVVLIPGLTEGLFPDPKVGDPDGWEQLPEQLRGDRDEFKPLELEAINTEKELDGARERRKERLREREMEEERRLCYVALTRAQRALYLSRAYWYFSGSRSRGPSRFWREIVGEEDAPSGLSTQVHEESDPGFNPKLQVGELPSAGRASSNGPLSRLLLEPDRGAGWIRRVAEADPEEWRGRVGRVERRLAAIAGDRRPAATTEPVAVSCSGLIQYEACPRLYRYLYVDRLPVRPMPWASLGTEVHRRIEEMARPGEEDAPSREEEVVDREDEDGPVGPGTAGAADMLRQYQGSRFGRRRATKVEEAFSLPIGGNLLRGRIDRIDRLPDGSWELADYKASRFHGELLPRQRLQMQLYALAAWRVMGIEPDRLTCHLLYLADGRDAVLRHPRPELEAVEGRANEMLEGIRLGVYPRSEGSAVCAGCDYHRVCEIGGR